MAYMIYQQYTTAVKEGYAGHPQPVIAQQAEAAKSCREWMESLEINAQIRDGLVEQIRALEEAFEELMR
jgi:hypothetical protein